MRRTSLVVLLLPALALAQTVVPPQPVETPPAEYPQSESRPATVVTQVVVGADGGMREVMQRVEQVAPTDVPVLLLGETGTGKGLIARTIHRAGPRASGPFVDINCAAIPEHLLEAELFGYEAGAFTDARRSKPGS